MQSQVDRSTELSPAARKKMLLAEGALYRASIIAAQADIAAGLKPSVLAKGAFAYLSGTAKATLLDAFRSGAKNPRALSPLLLTGISLLSKKYIRKPLMYAGIAGAAVAAAIYLIDKFSGGKADASGSVNDDVIT
jgi:hypothetical protein